MEVTGRRLEVRAEEWPPDEATEWSDRIVSVADYERYARATARMIPITPTGAGVEASLSVSSPSG